jgi:hypothetical protein
MEGFFYSSPRVYYIHSVNELVGELELPAGRYIVFAKADVATNSSASISAGGAARLEFGGDVDEAWVHLRVDGDGGNLESIALMVAAENDSTSQARLFFSTGWTDSTIVIGVRIAALRLTELNIVRGEREHGFSEEAYSSWIQFGASTGFFGSFIRPPREGQGT